jgi:hypothetical protein
VHHVLSAGSPVWLRLREAWARARLRAPSVPMPNVTRLGTVRDPESAPTEGVVECIVFSKDRPMQLDACLRSIVRHAPYRGSITVVYRATSDRFRQGYGMVKADSRVRLVAQEGDFREAVLRQLGEADDLVVFHTDDDLFFRTPTRAPPLPDGCAAFSLRLGENTTYCYPFARDQALPSRGTHGDLMVWDWSRADHDFAYPMSLNGHVFHAELVRELVRGASFVDPNELERELHLRRHRAPRLLASFRHSCVVSVPVNVVTDSIVNRSSGDPRLAPEALHEQFLQGVRIDLDELDFSHVRAAHEEIVLSFAGTAR